MKKFLSDVLIDCNLTVSGSSSLGAATGVTVDASDNSNKIATTAWVKGLGFSTANTTYLLDVPANTTNFRLIGSDSSTDTITLSAAGASSITRVSASELRITSSDSIDYVNSVSLVGTDLTFASVGNGFAGSIDLSGITGSFNAEEVQTVYENIKNVSGGPIQKGTPLAVVHGQTSGNVSDVVPAAADDPERMPAVFIANEDLADQAEGLGVVYGNITGIDTSAFDSGTTVYVAAGGGWTDTKPTGTNLIQNLGIITKSHASNGGGVVMGAGRSNDVPNIANGYAWVGNGSGVATPTLLGTAAYESASTFALANHNHDGRYYTQTQLDTEFNKYLRSDIPDSFNKLTNSSLNITPEWGGGAINLKPSVAGGSTGIVFTSAQNINTDNGKDHGYLWWYDNNNNYSINPGSQENGAVVLGVMNDSVENGMGDSAVVESSGNIFLNPGIDPTEGSQGGNSGPNFTRGKVYVGRAAEFYEVYHEGNLSLGDYAAANHVHDYDNYVSWNLKTNGTQRTTVQSGGNLDIVAGSNVSVAYGAGGVVTISSTDTNTDTNNYVTGLSFNTSNGILTATRQGLADLTVDLDGRYLTSFTETRTELSLASNILSYRDETGAVTELDLSLYLDDTNLARLTSGTLDSNTGIATFSRDDDSTFTVDFSALFDDVDNYVDSVAFSTTNGVLTIGRTGSLANLTVDLDGRYDLEGTAAAEAGAVNTRIDEEILPAIGEKLDSSVNPIKSATVSNDTITFTKADNTTFAITTSDANTNYYLDDITKSGNTLTYVMNGKTDVAYTFGSNAFTSYSNHVGLYDAVGTAASEAGAVNTRIDEEVLPLIQTPAILSNGSTPSLNTGISAAEIRTLIGAGTSSTDTNFYLSGASFNTGNGVLTLTVSGATDQTVDLDGRYLTSFTESDPVFTASPAGGITSENIGLWDEAHGWGDHAGLYANASHTHSATDITSGTLDGARLPWAANDGFSGTYPLVWKGDDRPYTASWLSIRGSDDTLLTRNISVSGNVTISSSIVLANGVLINNGAGDGVPQGTVIETFSASTYIGAFLDFTIYDDSKQNMRSGTLQLVFNADQVMFNEVNTMDIGDTTPCTLDAVNNGGTIDVRFTTPDPTFHIKYHVRTL